MDLVQSILKKNPRYNQHKVFTPKGLMLHSVGVAQPNAQVFIDQWNKNTYRTSCVHAIIDANTGTIYQTLPWDYAGWHGGGKSNNTHIGVEMAEPTSIKYTKGANFTVTNIQAAQVAVRKTYVAAVELFAMLCKKYGLNPLKDIISHSEGNKLGIATAHADPEHLWKGLQMSYTMDGFRKDVAKMMGVATESEKPASNIQNGSSTKEFTPYKVRVVVTNLHIRFSPSSKVASRGYIQPGAYTIVDEKDGWGLLKSYQKNRDGWIYLRYANPIA